MFDISFGFGAFLIIVGIISLAAAKQEVQDNQLRHQSDYGKVTRCIKCGSTKVYRMTYDDKRDSITFWGAASDKIGKTYHCDNCEHEW